MISPSFFPLWCVRPVGPLLAVFPQDLSHSHPSLKELPSQEPQFQSFAMLTSALPLATSLSRKVRACGSEGRCREFKGSWVSAILCLVQCPNTFCHSRPRRTGTTELATGPHAFFTVTFPSVWERWTPLGLLGWRETEVDVQVASPECVHVSF